MVITCIDYIKTLLALQYLFSHVCNVSEYLFKFLVIGSAGTGKSSLLNNFIGNKCKCCFEAYVFIHRNIK